MMNKITSDIIEYLVEKFYFHRITDPENTSHDCSMIKIDDLANGLDEYFSRKENDIHS